jgi:two-component system, OmpR family, sensor kinase
MARHFLWLYLLIAATLILASWGQDQLLRIYGGGAVADNKAAVDALLIAAEELHQQPPQQWRATVSALATATGVHLELLAPADIIGPRTLGRLHTGQFAFMQGSAGQSWALKQLSADYVLALRFPEQQEGQRGALEWAVTLLFYALIALVIMAWLWPLSRDLRALEHAASAYGNRGWKFDAQIPAGSQIYRLAETFRKMAARIDGLIASHKDMSNAVSHEIRTPLARMQFEIELAQRATDLAEVKNSLVSLKSDIAAIVSLVTATLEYAILERADMTINVGEHDLAQIIPAIVAGVRAGCQQEVRIECIVPHGACQARCDIHLIETALKNLLYNAARYARHEVRVTLQKQGAVNELVVEDDGPGIAPADRIRVFESFVRLQPEDRTRSGFGLGLAIVKRAVEWHGGTVEVSQSSLGGARFRMSWPDNRST